MPDLKLARGLSLPTDAVTRTFGIVGQRGTGKTSTAVALVEEIAPHAPFVVIDPTGAWYGLRSSKNGKGAGLECVVLGGHNGEVPLEETGGQLVADLVLRDRYSLVLDLELMRKGKQIRFVADFLEALYHGSREATFVVIDECQRFAPQNARGIGGDLPRSVGAVEDLVKLGRRKGLGAAFISQRPASIAKDVLEQAETMIVHRVTGPNDRKAIASWFEAQGEPDDEKAALAALPRLKRGEAYVMSPGFLEVFGEFKIREKRTFDSSKEPGIGEKVSEPRGRADVDLDALKDRMAATIERAEAEDPKALRRRIRELEATVSKLETQKPEESEPEIVEVPVLTDEQVEAIRAVTAIPDELRAIPPEVAEAWARYGKAVDDAVAPIAEELQRIETRVPARAPKPQGIPRPDPRTAGQRSSIDRASVRNSDSDLGDLTGPQQRVLDSLAWLAAVGFAQPSKIQVGFIAGYRVGKKVGGTYGNILGQLRAAGLLDYPSQGSVTLTAAGEAAANLPDIEQTTEGLQRAVFDRLAEPEQRVLQAIVDVYPDSISKVEAGELAGYTVGEKVGGTFGNILGRLRSLGLIDYPGRGEVVALPVLFLD